MYECSKRQERPLQEIIAMNQTSFIPSEGESNKIFLINAQIYRRGWEPREIHDFSHPKIFPQSSPSCLSLVLSLLKKKPPKKSCRDN